MSFARILLSLLIVAAVAGCGDIAGDLFPSGTDKRPALDAGATGPGVGQRAPEFSLPDTRGSAVTLAGALGAARGVVLYFTMWCPACDIHMRRMREVDVPAHAGVRFLVVDYVSATVEDARRAEIANGYAGSGFTVLADTAQSARHAYAATMGTTVVVDAAGVVRMSEDYRDGFRLGQVLGALP